MYRASFQAVYHLINKFPEISSVGVNFQQLEDAGLVYELAQTCVAISGFYQVLMNKNRMDVAGFCSGCRIFCSLIALLDRNFISKLITLLNVD